MSADESSTRAGGHAGRTVAQDVLREARFAANRGLPILPVGRQMSCPASKMSPEDGTTAAIEQLETGQVAGLAVRLGELSARYVEGRVRILMALDLDAAALTNPIFLSDWNDGIERSKAEVLLQRMRGGCAELTPGGGERLYFEMETADVDEWVRMLKEIPESDLSVRRDAQPLADILARGYSVIAPSSGDTHESGRPWTRTRGNLESAALVSGRELHILTNLLAELTDEPPVSVSGPLDPRTELVRALYNRYKGSDDATAALCATAGFIAKPHAPGDEIIMTRGPATVSIGGRNRQPGSLWTYDSAATPLTPNKPLGAFDVRLLLEVDKDGKRKDVADLAEELIKTREINLPARPLVPQHRPQIDLIGMDSATVVSKIVTSLQDSPHPSLPGVPFVIAEVTPTGAHVCFASLEKSGAVRRWKPKEQESLLLAVVQPVYKNKKDGAITMRHELPKAVQTMAIQAATAGEGIAHVTQISDTPILLRDGQIITEAGYHRAAGVLVNMHRRVRARWRAGYFVPSRISARDAQQAVDLLLQDWICDFPYDTDGDKARALSYMLTLASRPLVGNAPGFLFDAADRGTGKTLMAQLGRIVVSGSPLAQTITYELRDDTDLKKELVSATLAGMKFAHVDELPRGKEVTSRLLSELITSEGGMSGRVLGGNDTVQIANMTVSVCGNNATLGADMQRRFVPIRLSWNDGGLAQNRSGFQNGDIRTWTRENRPALLAALHTVLAYGLRNQVDESALPSGFGSFESWRNVVLGAMYHVSIDGQRASDLVADGRALWAESQDEEGDEWADLMQHWYKKFGTKFVKASEASDFYGQGGFSLPDLPEDLVPQIGMSPKGLSRRWGKRLTLRRDTAVSVAGTIYRFKMREDHKNCNTYRIEAEGEHIAPVIQLRSPTHVVNPDTGETELAF